MKDAERYFNNALQLAEQLGKRNMVMESYRGLATLSNMEAMGRVSLKKKNEYMLRAMGYYKSFIAYVDSVETRKH